ncbi:hypothetical protein CEP54_003300 [Fusarium duplospermum]|uniref:Uncharacterized protein n=1 Tax=Fusarium duplospermum TaxID=1325734 RepID=A0A428QPP7_9HYPO|nr:hypothetical protein CEP54_003300 [Fusarium duplospermum]
MREADRDEVDMCRINALKKRGKRKQKRREDIGRWKLDRMRKSSDSPLSTVDPGLSLSRQMQLRMHPHCTYVPTARWEGPSIDVSVNDQGSLSRPLQFSVSKGEPR